MTKVYLVMGGYHYEGSDCIYIASSQEKADQWVKNNWEKYFPRPKVEKWKHKTGEWYGDFDFLEVTEMPVDELDASQH